MSDNRNDDETDGTRLARLAAVLDIHGSEPRHWPAGEQAALLAFAAANADAARLLAEERALDAVLRRAPAAGLDVTALLDRIAGAAAREPRLLGAPVVPFNADRLDRRPAAPLPRRSRQSLWPAATALAASLVIGLLIGASEQTAPAIDALINGADTDTDVALVSLPFGAGTDLQEEPL